MILSKMEAFSNKWINVKDQKGLGVFTQETMHAISNLKRHVSQGCLSDIPIGGGTNRNERFHHHINSILHRNKIGILLAYALLTVVIHSYNSAKTVKSKTLSEPICNSRFRHDLTCGPLQPIGILPKDRETRETDTQCEIDVSSCMFDFDEVKVIYLHALTKFHVLTSLKYMGLVKLGELVKHFASNSGLEQGCSADVSSESQLSQTLQSNGLIFTPIIGDGNCFFSAIAKNVATQSKEWHLILSNMGISNGIETENISNLAMKLRQLFVTEMLGCRRAEYEPFIDPLVDDYETEVNKFLQPNFHISPVGNAMPLAIANSLQCSIVIFSADTRLPTTYVTPTCTSSIDSCATAFVIYNSLGNGHYDAALPFVSNTANTPISANTENSTNISCRCGTNKKVSSTSCKNSPFYASRCCCLKNNQQCTSHCQCVNCHNPNGKKPISESPTTAKRMGRKHHLQMSLPSSKRFAVDRNEDVAKGQWSEFETITLYEIVSTEKNVGEIKKVYNDVVDYSIAPYCEHKLPTKTESQVASKLKYDDLKKGQL